MTKEYTIRFKDQSRPLFFSESEKTEFADRFVFDVSDISGELTDIDLVNEDGQVIGWVLPA